MSAKKLIQIVDTVSRRGGVYALLGSSPRSVTSFRIVSRLKSMIGDIRTVIDGGANVGQFARAISNAYPDCKIISFEPIPDISQSLANNLSDHGDHEVIQAALGNELNQVELRVASNGGQSSSVLPFSDQGLLKGIYERDKVTVPLITLDSVFDDRELPGPVLLKLDLQGYELEALKGAVNTLSRCDYVLVESVLERSYVGEPHFSELIKFLEDQSFSWVGIMNVEENNRKQIVQLDGLFAKYQLNEVM